MRFLLLAVAAISLFGLAGAGTVTLTGTCPNSLSRSSNYIFFNISNSGTDPALNMQIIPNLTGFSTYNASESIGALGPTQSITKYFYIYNFSYNGTYAEAFLAKYDQGGSTFYAVFPCPVSIGASTTPIAAISSITEGPGDTLNVTVANRYNVSVSATLSVIAPPALSMSPKSRSILLQPGAQQSLFFSFAQPPSGQSFTTAFSLSYLDGGQHYASVMDYVVGSGNSLPVQQGGSSDSIIIWGFALLVALILILIALSLRRNGKRDRGARGEQQSQQQPQQLQQQGRQENQQQPQEQKQ
ncbi:MAG: hypothetical protein LVQ95_01475 [Candidatus Micrarchaeales archaeon]|nr:hypothetical protein [Candidatus Micrarchaeales archaeon]